MLYITGKYVVMVHLQELECVCEVNLLTETISFSTPIATVMTKHKILTTELPYFIEARKTIYCYYYY
jgi:hypothetical protein